MIDRVKIDKYFVPRICRLCERGFAIFLRKKFGIVVRYFYPLALE